jgi:transcriptional regulator with XRE-family HTH domain
MSDPKDEGRIATTWQNRAAGQALRLARSSMDWKQAAFVSRLARDLGITLSVGGYSAYENGRRAVPGAVLVAAALISGASLDALLAEVGQPELEQWTHRPESLSQRLAALERQVADLQVAAMDRESAQPTAPEAEVDAEQRPGGRASDDGRQRADGTSAWLADQAQTIEDLRAQLERLIQVVGAVPDLQATIKTQGEAIKRMAKQLRLQDTQAPQESRSAQRPSGP